MRYLVLPPPPPRKYVRALLAAALLALRMAAWNALSIIVGLILIALVGEMYLRLANPFIAHSLPFRFVDGVGLVREPNGELRYANWDDDIFVASRANSLGFLDREPVSAERAAAGCHIAFIGDSFVEAIQVPIADKFHVRLEEMAARELPHLAITTQAYGILNTGQINQLPFYDEYARRLNPKLLVLVFYINDFVNNSIALQSIADGLDPDRSRYMSAQKDALGNMELRPPDPEYRRFMLPRMPIDWHEIARKRLIQVSYFAKWLDMKQGGVVDRVNAIGGRTNAPSETDLQVAAWADMLAARPCCTLLLAGSQSTERYTVSQFTEEILPPPLEDELEYTAFGIDQFKRRADRDDATLLIIAATDDMGTRGDPQFDRLNAIAEARGIPIISQYDYIVSQRHDYKDGRWRNDIHWNAVGHQWVAEAVLEYLKANQGVCD